MNASQRGLLVEGGSGLVMALRVSEGSFSHLEVSEESTRKVWLVAFTGCAWIHWASVVGVAIPGCVFMVSIVWGVRRISQIGGGFGGLLRSVLDQYFG